MTEPRRPLHLAVALGVSAGVYAVSLAGVTALQAGQEAALAADRVPTLDALASLRVHNDRLGVGVDTAGAAYEAAANGYQDVAKGLDRLDGRLAKLATTVAAIEGAGVTLPARAPLPARAALPARATLPPVTRTIVVARAPAVHSTTGASGQPAP